MDKFTASNGVSVMIPIEDPHEAVVRVVFEDDGGRSLRRFNADELSALREFSVHERDVELGRWRWPENPDWVVYRASNSNGDHAVLNEQSGYYALWGRDTVQEPAASIQDPVSCAAARAYFVAHPEPKPWHDAKPGEVWVVNAGETLYAMTVHESEFGGLRFRSNDRDGTIWALDTPAIFGARRIFPEVPND